MKTDTTPSRSPFDTRSHDYRIIGEWQELRLGSLQRKLEKNPELSEKYTEGMQDLLGKGYAVEVSLDEAGRQDGKVCYLPHHPVVNPNKEKLRIVFNCAAQHLGVSLNSRVLQGPDLTNKLIGVLTRFRLHQIALMARRGGHVSPGASGSRRSGCPPFSMVATREQKRGPLDVSNDCTPFWGDVVTKLLHVRDASDSPGLCAPVLEDGLRDGKEKFFVDDCLKSVSSVEEAVGIDKGIEDSACSRRIQLNEVDK